MKLIPLSRNLFAMVDDDDYDYLMQWKWYAHHDPSSGRDYAVRNCRKTGKHLTIKMHRVILNVSQRNIFVDHKDHNGLNNTKENIRLCTPAENARNKHVRKGSSKYVGVCWHKVGKAWTASVVVNGVKKRLGLFKTEEDAARARDVAAKEQYGEFANLNFKE